MFLTSLLTWYMLPFWITVWRLCDIRLQSVPANNGESTCSGLELHKLKFYSESCNELCNRWNNYWCSSGRICDHRVYHVQQGMLRGSLWNHLLHCHACCCWCAYSRCSDIITTGQQLWERNDYQQRKDSLDELCNRPIIQPASVPSQVGTQFTQSPDSFVLLFLTWILPTPF